LEKLILLMATASIGVSMFTGIIQDIGVVESISYNENSIRMSLATILDEVHLSLGASIACNGCCLTLVEHYKKLDKNFFTVDVGYQSLALTNFNSLKIGSFVNLEPALRVGDALGGHHMSGHIDSLCKVLEFHKVNEEFWKLTLQIPQKFAKWLIPKGSIGVSGISLTIANISSLAMTDSLVEIMIIPHTFHNTILQYIASEMSIEIEFDQTVKAIASILETMLPSYIQARK
jgi:riboflavin synthase